MRKIIIVLTCCIVLLLLGYTSYRGYQVWKQSHGLAMAKGYMAKSDTRNESLALQQVLKANPRNLEASRMMADLLQTDRPTEALRWREHVLEINPGSLEDRVALAQVAVVMRNYSLATNTLAGATEADKQTAAYHRIAGLAALLGGEAVEAETHFSESIRLDPSDQTAQINLAVVRLHGTNTLDMAEARIALRRIIMNSTNAVLRLQAQRELVNDALHSKDFPTAVTVSKDLVQQTNAVFTDKLLRLDVLKAAQNNEYQSTLASYQSEAAANPDKIEALTKWEVINLSLTDALGWLRSLPVQMKTNQTVEILVATCQMQLNDWHGLQAGIQDQKWNEPDPLLPGYNLEYKRHAYLARSLRGQGLTEASTAEWAVAVKAASDLKYRFSADSDLFEMALAWKWSTEAEGMLWTLVNQFPEEKGPYFVLRNVLIIEHRTRALMQLMQIMHKRMPNDLAIKNNLAATSLLLGDQSSKPYDLAKEVYETSPKSPQLAATYAFSLYLQGKNADALKVMQQIDSKALQVPSIALYYGLILKANGNNAEAKAYLGRVSRAELWPEEQSLFDQAKAGL